MHPAFPPHDMLIPRFRFGVELRLALPPQQIVEGFGVGKRCLDVGPIGGLPIQLGTTGRFDAAVDVTDADDVHS